METIPLRMLKDFWLAVTTEAKNQGVTNSQYAEHLIRNGISIAMMYLEAARKNEKNGIKLLGGILKTGITGITVQESQPRIATTPISGNPMGSEILDKIDRCWRDNMKTTQTTLHLTDNLTEYLSDTATEAKRPLNFLTEYYLQVSLVGWQYRDNFDPTDYEGFDHKKIEKYLEDIHYSYVDFEPDDLGNLQLILKKKVDVMKQKEIQKMNQSLLGKATNRPSRRKATRLKEASK